MILLASLLIWQESKCKLGSNMPTIFLKCAADMLYCYDLLVRSVIISFPREYEMLLYIIFGMTLTRLKVIHLL